MKWTFKVENKLRASISIFVLCVVVIFSNYRLKRLSSTVMDSVKTIYEDRLLVQELIFSYDQVLDQLTIGALNDSLGKNQLYLKQKVNEIHSNYAKTVLTDEEAKVFESFSLHINKMIQDPKIIGTVELADMKSELARLSQIQLEEAKRQMDIIKEAKGRQKLLFFIETVILVLLLVIVQVLLNAHTSLKKMSDQRDFHLN